MNETSRFRVGDRVIERSRNWIGSSTTSARPGLNRRRRGQVVATEERSNRRGVSCLYVSVIWDGSRSPSLHAGHRLLNVNAL
jgi:hypothetical protein